jgi:hypothetical protein
LPKEGGPWPMPCQAKPRGVGVTEAHERGALCSPRVGCLLCWSSYSPLARQTKLPLDKGIPRPDDSRRTRTRTMSSSSVQGIEDGACHAKPLVM